MTDCINKVINIANITCIYTFISKSPAGKTKDFVVYLMCIYIVYSFGTYRICKTIYYTEG